MYESMGYETLESVNYIEGRGGEYDHRKYGDFGGLATVLHSYADPPRIYPHPPETHESRELVTQAVDRCDYAYLKQAYIDGACVYQSDIMRLDKDHETCTEGSCCVHHPCMDLYRKMGYQFSGVDCRMGFPQWPQFWDYGGMPLVLPAHNDKFETYPKLDDAYEKRIYGGLVVKSEEERGPDGMGLLFDLD
jgi:hypothetical protein